jgi:Transposase DDE domain
MTSLTLTQHLSQEVFNEMKPFAEILSRPQEFNARELVRGLLLSGSTHLSKIGRSGGAAANERKTVERLSTALAKIPVDAALDIHVNRVAQTYVNEPILIFSDCGDLQKPHAKVMEKVCGTVDGSKGHSAGRGYPIHGMMVYGLESKSLDPLSLHVFSTQSEDFKSQWDEEKKNFQRLVPLIAGSVHDRIIVEDRGCDDEKRFLYFVNELQASFVTRVHSGTKSRNVLIKKYKGEYDKISIKDLSEKMKGAAGASREWTNKKLGGTLTSKIAYQEVFLEGHTEVPLYAVFCYSEGFDEPLVILTDLRTESAADAWKHFFYYKKRWEVENFYRAAKQQFGMEEFLILGFEKIRALLFLVMIAYHLLRKLQAKAVAFLGVVHILFKQFCKGQQRSSEHPLDLLAFLREVFAGTQNHYRFYAQHFKKHLSYICSNQPSLFPNRKKW